MRKDGISRARTARLPKSGLDETSFGAAKPIAWEDLIPMEKKTMTRNCPKQRTERIKCIRGRDLADEPVTGSMGLLTMPGNRTI